jgi:Zn-dependent protease with chaperone function
VLSNGGWEAVVRLSRSPASLLVLFGPGQSRLWAEGAAGAFLVFLAAFLLNQLVGRGLLRLLDPRPLAWPAALPEPSTPTSLLACRSERPEAFSFTLLELHGSPSPVVRREVIVVSDRLVALLDAEELEAVVAHELGHLQRLDGRYLTFLRTLSRMMRWDPVLAYLSRALTRREEYYADEHAVRMTGRPLPLARALAKVSSQARGTPPPALAALPSLGGRGADREAEVRIRRLLAMAESRAPLEALGA